MNTQVKYCLSCGSSLIIKNVFGAERPACPVCGWIYFADPKVAAAIFLIHDEKILLTQRSYDPFKNYWALPAGFIDAGEDPRLAAERECLEETGLVIKSLDLLDMFSGREHPHGADIVLVFRAHLLEGQLCAGDDASAAAFFSAAELPPLAFKATQQIVQRWLGMQLK
ncbi:MAG: NUDIX domain-containing protein [Anaerolineae bacterium]|nr:NUDIX domain-containing protein [Anaerolineae bacterium]